MLRVNYTLWASMCSKTPRIIASRGAAHRQPFRFQSHKQQAQRHARREEAGAPPARSASTVGGTGFRCDEPSSGALELEFSWFAATHAVYSTPYYGAPQRQGVHRGGGRTRVL